ncbi:MAG: DNA-directed DNA polymerase I, partial [Candidatus Njordarchaeota archaeon]
MKHTTLDQFLKKPKATKKKEKLPRPTEKEVTPTKSALSAIRKIEEEALESLIKISNKPRGRKHSNKAFLLGIDYDPDTNKAVMKFYDIETENMFLMIDWTDHKPYLLTDLSKEEIKGLASQHGVLQNIVDIIKIRKYHPLFDKEISINKVIVRTPQGVGGSGGKKGLRTILGEEHVWEARIKYYLCYLYDNKKLWPSAIYEVENNDINLAPSGEINDVLEVIDKRFTDLISKYVPILMQEIPPIRFYAMDIEAGSSPDKMPDARDPNEPVISISLIWYDTKTHEYKGEVYLLDWKKRKDESYKDIKIIEEHLGYKIGLITLNSYKIPVRIYQSERLLLIDVFKKLWDIPILITFNGDNFDLNYLLARAKRLGIDRKLVPFTVRRTGDLIIADMRIGVHIDLYKFYSNGAIKAYVFKDIYETTSLDELAFVLLGERKLFHNVVFEEMSLGDIAKYNWWDAYLTAKLFTFNNWLPFRVMVILSRITRYPIKDLTRRGVSGWIGNWFYAEMRERNWLIPNDIDFEKKKEKMELAPRPQPVIKGKKYRGAVVFQPKAGTWFNVYVLDFASIYPTIIKVHNISFDTVLCPHEECKNNKVIDLDYWICTKKNGLASNLVGFIRDLRVNYYKKLSKKHPDPQKREFYSVIQGALKVLINASYGVFGAETFSLFFLPVAESITSIGRHKILAVAEKARKMNLDVIYGDTDSIFIHNPSKENIEDLIDWTSKELRVDLEVDKAYIFVSFSERKKNYFGLLKDGNLDIKGLLGKKRNTPEFLKKEFVAVLEILRKVRTPEDMKAAKKKIEEKIIEIYQKLSKGLYSVEDLAFRVMISKPIEKYTK